MCVCEVMLHTHILTCIHVPSMQVEARVPADVIKFGQPGIAFVCVKRNEAIQSLFIKANKLVFQKKEVDPSSGEVSEDFSEEEYPLDELEVRVCT